MEEKLIDTKNRPAVNIIAGVTNIKTIYNKTPCVFVIEHGYIARKKNYCG
ncbi:hypothetical protein [Photorhabdus temperata]|uniref:Uncharacterized protein n=1 Tax=Photorhabdus temperata J3 TaxID=1389415 RepID=U7R0T1_PHOTE|nr:hypothetical protein [Photorhabdus temperata]ERT13070.1 hypothetical protein O185_10775 [Photorhabdus temperata J3]